MPNDPTPPPALPGDIVEVTTHGRRGALVVVEDVYAGRIAGYMPFARTISDPTEQVPVRLRLGEFARVGTAALVSPGLAKAREAAIATLAEPAAPSPVKDPPGDPDDLTPIWEVEVRFNGRTTGAGQSHRERVRADCVEEAYDRVSLPVMAHGGSVCVTGVTIDEVRR